MLISIVIRLIIAVQLMLQQLQLQQQPLQQHPEQQLEGLLDHLDPQQRHGHQHQHRRQWQLKNQ